MERVLQIGGQDEVVKLFGPRDSHLKRLRDAFAVGLVARAGEVRIDGPAENVRRCEGALLALEAELNRGIPITAELVGHLIEKHQAEPAGAVAAEVEAMEEIQPWPGASPRTPGQAAYVRAMLSSDVVFCIGPAGTGKTYLGVAVALNFLNRGDLKRIVLCRPAVEAGESLGFLPGDIYAKVNPYLRPLYDALHDLMDVRRVKRYIDNDVIEILPLAFVRGRTLDNAFIILDEAQNCTVGQMKTFLTRLGTHARLVVTGDITQIDLPPGERSGLVDAQERLRGVPGIRMVWLDEKDIVRHRLVRLILNAYNQDLPASPKPQPEGEGPHDAPQ
ncbi:MAG: PhoH family protein [Planctomycetota bacterium]